LPRHIRRCQHRNNPRHTPCRRHIPISAAAHAPPSTARSPQTAHPPAAHVVDENRLARHVRDCRVVRNVPANLFPRTSDITPPPSDGSSSCAISGTDSAPTHCILSRAPAVRNGVTSPAPRCLPQRYFRRHRLAQQKRFCLLIRTVVAATPPNAMRALATSPSVRGQWRTRR